MNKRKFKLLLCLFVLSLSNASHAQWAVFDGSNFAKMIMLIQEAKKRYSQLRGMMNEAKEHHALVKQINSGLINSVGILESLGVKDEGILKEIKSFQKAIKSIDDIYGSIPNSLEAPMHVLHDKTVAESLRMINSFKDFTHEQEANSQLILSQSRDASPKGAQRMTAESNALILQGVSQLIRLQNQSLKMQSEQFAMLNKREKEEVKSYQQINAELDSAFRTLKVGGNLPRF